MQMTLHLFFFYFIIHIVFDFELSAVIYKCLVSKRVFIHVMFYSYVCLYISSLYVVPFMFFFNTMLLVYNYLSI